MAKNLVKTDKEGWIIHPTYHHVKLAPAQDPEKIPDLQDYMIPADYGKKPIFSFLGENAGRRHYQTKSLDESTMRDASTGR